MTTATNENFKIILKQMQPLINSIIKKWSKNKKIDKEDLRSEAEKALWEAVTHYQERPDVKFETYAYTCIKNAIIKFYYENCYTLHASIYHQKKDKDFIQEQERNLVKLNNPIHINGSELYFDVPSTTFSPFQTVSRLEDIKCINDAIKTELTDRERYVLNNSYMFFGRKSLEQISWDLKCTKQNISNIIGKIKVKLKNKLSYLEAV